MQGVIVRPAIEEDFEQLLSLLDNVAAELKWISTEPGFDRERYRLAWRGIARGTGGAQFVACDGADIVGQLSIYVSSTGDHHLGMIVRKDRRGKGVGTALVLAAFGWAKQHRIQALTLGVFPHNTAAVALYRKMGFIETGCIEGYSARVSGELWDIIRMRKSLNG